MGDEAHGLPLIHYTQDATKRIHPGRAKTLPPEVEAWRVLRLLVTHLHHSRMNFSERAWRSRRATSYPSRPPSPSMVRICPAPSGGDSTIPIWPVPLGWRI